MKHRRIGLAGCGDHRSGYFNHEGYPDPTAGCAINGTCGIYPVLDKRKSGKRENTVKEKLPPISELGRYLAGMDMPGGKDERKKDYTGHSKNES